VERFGSARILAQFDSLFDTLADSDYESPTYRSKPDETISAPAIVARRAELEQVRLVTQELIELSPPGAMLILANDTWFGGSDSIPGRRAHPFPEEGGMYAGPPLDDESAIMELERLRASGASYIAFAWMTFWWLEHYRGFSDFLCASFPCVLRNERVIVFDLRHVMERERRLMQAELLSNA
jgi:hypothetical protein